MSGERKQEPPMADRGDKDNGVQTSEPAFKHVGVGGPYRSAGAGSVEHDPKHNVTQTEIAADTDAVQRVNGGGTPLAERPLSPGDRGYRRREAGRLLRRLFVPTGHAELDQVRRDGLAAEAPWHSALLAGVVSGVLPVVAGLLVYATYGLSAVGIVLAIDGMEEARRLFASHLDVVASYARYLWLTGLTAGSIGGLYAFIRRWTVLRGRYIRLRPWEVGGHTLYAAFAGYVTMFIAASLWSPLEEIHRLLFWAWGPIIAWLFPRLQDILLLLIVRPDWSLSVRAATRILVSRRCGCPREQIGVDVDETARTVTITAPVAGAEKERLRELIQAIPETAAVRLELADR